jgi:hypothetical protein
MTAPIATIQGPCIDGPKHRPLLRSLPILIATVHLTVPSLSGPIDWLAEQRGRTGYLYLDHYLGIHWALAPPAFSMRLAIALTFGSRQ